MVKREMSIPYNGMDFQACVWHVRNAIMRCGWGIKGEGPQGIYASVPISFWSWGENIEVHFYQGFFTIRSASVFPLQIVDWGRNNSNLQKFAAAYNASCAGL